MNLQNNYKAEEVWISCSENILAWQQKFYQLMLNDQLRMLAYQKAIQETVKPGMVVLDLGTGTGILGLWALQAGAKHLYAIDLNSEIIGTAIQTFEQAGFAEKYDVYPCLSFEVNLPQQVDLVISEIMGNLADNENFVPILNDAQQRFLKPEGKMLPSFVCSKLVPISSLKAHQQIQSKNVQRIHDSYSVEKLLQRLSLKSPFNLYYDAIIPHSCYLSEPQLARRFSMDGEDQPVYAIELTFAVNSNNLLTGFKGSFVAKLSDSVTLDISGDDIEAEPRTTSDSWKHCYLPIETPIEVKQGDEINLKFKRFYPRQKDSPFRQCYQWSGSVTRQENLVNTFHQSMECEKLMIPMSS